MGMALESKRIVETNLIRVSYRCISYYFLPFKWLYTSYKTERFGYKVGRWHTSIKVFKKRAGLGNT